MKLVTLPNGLQVEALEPFEAQTLYREIFEDGVYSGHGIQIQENDTVVDVGANIGLFSLLALRDGRQIQLFAIEPIPILHGLLRRNLERYARESAVTVLPVGLAAQGGEAEFVYTPHSTMTSSMVSARRESDLGVSDVLRAGLTDLAQIYPARRSFFDQLRRLLPVPIVGGVVTLGLLAGYAIPATRNFLQRRRVQCPLLTLSQVIEQYQITTIDLLKIDVEGSEAEVLAGIAEAHWPRIRQIVIEVHDVDGRVSQMRDLLESRGYQTQVEQEDWALLRLMHCYTLYARQLHPDSYVR